MSKELILNLLFHTFIGIILCSFFYYIVKKVKHTPYSFSISLILTNLIILLTNTLFYSTQHEVSDILRLLLFYQVFLFLLKIALNIYSKFSISKKKPLKAFVSFLNIIALLLCIFHIIATLTNQDPLIVLGSLSTVTAFISFIFKDVILGFYASLQLTSNDTLHIGDYIEVKNLNLQGTVTSIDLITISLAQPNHSVITVPAYSLVSNPLVNFRHLYLTQGRLFQNTLSFPNVTCSANNIDNFISETTLLLKNHPQINTHLPYTVTLESVEFNQLKFNIFCYSSIKDFHPFNEFSSTLTNQIRQIAKNNTIL